MFGHQRCVSGCASRRGVVSANSRVGEGTDQHNPQSLVVAPMSSRPTKSSIEMASVFWKFA